MALTRYQNFFNEEDRKCLLDLHKQLFLNDKEYFDKNIKDHVYVDFYKFFIIDRACGRATTTIPAKLIPKNILDAVSSFGQNINKNAVLEFATFVTYSNKYGNPQLIPHFDKPKKVPFLIDYQMNANKSWPLIVDGEEIIHEDNEAIVLDSTRSMHWRKPDIFEDGEEVSVIFFSFHDSEMEESEMYWQKEKIDEAFELYSKEADAVYVGAMKLNYKKILGMW